MSNKYHNRDTAPSKQTGGEGGSNEAMGSAPSLPMPEKTAAWPGLPGNGGPNRAAGTPTTGYFGPFVVDKEGL